MDELTQSEKNLIVWVLEQEVRNTLLLRLENNGRIPVMCSECGGEAFSRGEIEHTPGCDVAPVWALYDKLSRAWRVVEELPPEAHPSSPPGE